LKIIKGTVTDIKGDPFTGVALVGFSTENGGLDVVYTEYIALICSLIQAYSEMITHDARLNFEAIKGKEVYYSKDEDGLLWGFMPVEDADIELVALYGYNKGKEIPVEEFENLGWITGQDD
jgi:hypothetical protein